MNQPETWAKLIFSFHGPLGAVLFHAAGATVAQRGATFFKYGGR